MSGLPSMWLSSTGRECLGLPGKKDAEARLPHDFDSTFGLSNPKVASYKLS